MRIRAGVAELADALDLGSSDASRGGSSPSARTRPPSRPRMSPLGQAVAANADHRDQRRRAEARIHRHRRGRRHRAPGRPTRLDEIGRAVRLPGFRPGKVPMTVLRQRYGRSVMGEVLERAVNDSSAEAMRERNLRPALQPKVEIVNFNEGADLEYKMAVEVLPEIAADEFRRAQARAPQARGARRGGRPGARAHRPAAAQERAGRARRRQGRRRRDRLRRHASTASRFPGGSADGLSRSSSAPAASFPASRISSSAPRPASSAPSTSTFPGRLRQRRARRQAGAASRSPSRRCARSRRSRSTTSLATAVGMDNARRAAQDGARADRARLRPPRAAAAEARAARQPGRAPRLPGAAGHGRDRVQHDLAAGRGRAQAPGQAAAARRRRRARHRDQGRAAETPSDDEAEGRVPRHRRAPGAARPAARRGRPRQYHHRDPGRDQPRADGARRAAFPARSAR